MSEVFGPEYAAAYDRLYRDKDYRGECELLERLFARHAGSPVSTILDLGCGTGGHTLVLTERGYSMIGVDRSVEMLDVARAKANALPEASRPVFVHADLTTVDVVRQCDAAIMMFAVLGYQVAPGAALAALRAAHRNLRPGGLLIADAWYGPAVLAQRPGQRWRIDSEGDDRILRCSSAEVDELAGTCSVVLHLWRLRGDRLVAEAGERHLVRYFSRPQIEGLLAEAGFELLRLGAFPAVDDEPGETTWNVVMAARALSPVR